FDSARLAIAIPSLWCASASLGSARTAARSASIVASDCAAQYRGAVKFKATRKRMRAKNSQRTTFRLASLIFPLLRIKVRRDWTSRTMAVAEASVPGEIENFRLQVRDRLDDLWNSLVFADIVLCGTGRTTVPTSRFSKNAKWG